MRYEILENYERNMSAENQNLRTQINVKLENNEKFNTNIQKNDAEIKELQKQIKEQQSYYQQLKKELRVKEVEHEKFVKLSEKRDKDLDVLEDYFKELNRKFRSVLFDHRRRT